MSQHGSAEKLAQYKPKKIVVRRYMSRAAVCLILREDAQGKLQVLMMQRAERRGDPWSGHMAFPGGKMSRTDKNSYTSALRELMEETGLPAAGLQSYGRLSDVLTRNHSGKRGMVVTPFVFRAAGATEFNPNHEVAELLWIPLDFIANPSHREKMHYQTRAGQLNLPCYMYEGKRIWGLSLSILDELIYLLYRQRFAASRYRAFSGVPSALLSGWLQRLRR